MKHTALAWFVAATLLAGCQSATHEEQPVSVPAAPQAAAAPAPAPAPAQSGEAAQAPKEVKLAVSGDLLGNGQPVTVEILAPAKPPEAVFNGILTLQVRNGDQVLASAPATGTTVDAIHLVDFAGVKHPFIVLTGRQEAVSDHSGFAQVFRYTGAGLQQVDLLLGWMGSAWVATQDGRPVIGISTSEDPASNEYIDINMRLKPSPRPIRQLFYAWEGGRFQQVAETSTRLAYGLYDHRDFEKPLTDATVAQYKQGQQLLAAGKPAEAITLLQAALKAEPEYPDALSDLALAYAQLNRWQESRDAAAQAVKLNPWHPYAQFNLGVALLNLNQPALAVSALKIATGLQLDRWETHFWLGQAYDRQGQTKEARTEYEAALKLQPDNADIKAHIH